MTDIQERANQEATSKDLALSVAGLWKIFGPAASSR